ncbi:MAG: hypothetical protein J0H40_24250 [Rhizobiales bacterium]|nr:hypothetical protein [Hyphomicrobiales bacterium]
MLEVTAADIYALSDEDLRTLVGLLCEADARTHGIPTSSVTWGGNQNAPDGGIDVRVNAPTGSAPTGFLVRASIGFQVKKTDFTPGLIPGEMRPTGTLRPSIRELIDRGGAYIIASSGTDASDSALNDRVVAMRTAVADVPGHDGLLVDFYDRNRIATWVRNHPGICAWIRQRCGRILSGWQPYGGWAVSPEGVQDVYLLDDKARLHAGITDEKGVELNTGITRIRDILRNPRGVVRLAGLSGVGKTRLVQALFDDRIGNNALDPALVLYTDINDNPTPQPIGMVTNLVMSRTRAIVVVDNCQPELHRRLTEVCRGPDSTVSIITVEYDVQDDEPEGTEVYKLEPSSVPVVAQLLARRFPEMLRVDVDRIAEFSGGNARMALALANTLEKHESVAGLRDEELFKRLMHQRQAPDDSLLKAAQAFSLLYSFEGETLTGDAAELPQLGVLVGMSGQDMYAKVAQLKQRDLVQRRSVWRAVLPHAIANRLAKMALEQIPFESILEQFTTQRLLKSFTRRLSYLHESEAAVRIATAWLEPGAYLGNVHELNEFGQTLVTNVAPVAPEAVLAAIERAMAVPGNELAKDYSFRNRYISTLHSIAYDAPLFDRCVAILIQMAMAEPTQNNHPATSALKHLFHLFLSGTHAPVEQRVQIADRLLSSENPAERALGRQLLESLLEADNFMATHSFDFGSRVRDYGYWPSTRAERIHWFVQALRLARKHAISGENAAFAREQIASAIRAIWVLGPDVQQEFEAFADDLGTGGYWHEGWIAVRNALALPKKPDAEGIDRLRKFEKRLKPQNVEQYVRAVVLTQSWGRFDFAEMDGDDEDEGEAKKGSDANPLRHHERANALAEELGGKVATDEAVFERLLPDLVSNSAQRAINFGNGLAAASADPRGHWSKICTAFKAVPEATRSGRFLIGFLTGLNKAQPELCEALLEEAVEDETLAPWFPILQTNVAITPAGAKRLKRSLELAKAELHVFRNLGFGRTSDALSGADLRDIILGIAGREGGFAAAIDILSMRFHAEKHSENNDIPPELIAVGRDLLAKANLDSKDQSFDYHLQSIAKVCLAGPEGVPAMQAFCAKIRQGLADYTFRMYAHENLLTCLFKLQPRVALDAFFPSSPVADELELDVDDFKGVGDRTSSPLDEVPTSVLLDWCDEAPEQRYPAIAKVVSFFTQKENEPVEWSPIALTILDRAPDPAVILQTFVGRFSPRSWSGSRAEIVEARAGLLDRLPAHHATAFAQTVASLKAELADDVAKTRKWENERDRERDERFE